MGKVAVTYRILPEGTEIDLDEMEKSVRSMLGSKLVKLESKPIAFGLKALMATVVVEDGSGEGDKIEASLGALSGVSSVETAEVGLI